jgi:hypothetical protein
MYPHPGVSIDHLDVLAAAGPDEAVMATGVSVAAALAPTLILPSKLAAAW